MSAAFSESNRLRERFMALSGHRFSVVYQALCECRQMTNSNLLDEEQVARRIVEIGARPGPTRD